MATLLPGVTCWVGMLNFDLCCRGPWGEGLASCWEEPFSWDLCCKPEFQKKNVTQPLLEEYLLALDENREPPGSSGYPAGYNALNVFANPNAPGWMKEMRTCLEQYDEPASRRWFLAHSGVPAHFVAHVGNPGACIDGGHRFYWGLLVVGINLAGNPYQETTMSDVSLEFSICVPASCQYAVTDAVLVPFYMGPYLGKPWGPNPEFLYRFKHLGGGIADPGMQTLQASAASWMSDILTRGPSYHREFYEREWPFRRELWEYESTWWPSPRNEAILSALILPPLLAGVCLALLNCFGVQVSASQSTPTEGKLETPAPVQPEGAKPAATQQESKMDQEADKSLQKGKPLAHAGGAAAAVANVIHAFAPQTYVKELTAPIKNDLVGMHKLRILLQVLVTWQHTILFVEWLGNAGHHGIVNFLPLTHDIAKILGRVNTTFACLTVHLSLQSAVRMLQSGDKKAAALFSPDRILPANGSSSANGHKPAAGARQKGKAAGSAEAKEAADADTVEVSQSAPASSSAPRAGLLVWLWVVRRWVRQAAELGLWTFYFNEITQDIPWKPFPDFVQVWYRDRAKACRREMAEHQPQLPMWLLSLFFVYEPVNAVLRLHRPPVSLCHNMQVFENLFTLSVCGAILAIVKHCFGRKALFSLAALFMAISLRIEPPWQTEQVDDEEIGWDMVIFSTMEMLPAAVTCALLLSEVWTEQKEQQRPTPWWKYTSAIVAGLSLDFIRMGHATQIGEYIPLQLLRLPVVAIIRTIQTTMETIPTAAFFARELLHAVGVALLLQSLKPETVSSRLTGAAFPGWARAISRLSLSINLTNIFTIHYVRGRLLDHAVEFSHVHGFSYTMVAWVSAVAVSLAAHCMVSPYVAGAEAVLNWVNRKALSLSASWGRK